MQLDVAQQLRQAVGTVTTFDLQEPFLTVDDADLHSLTGSAILLRTDRGLLVSVHVAAAVHQTCSRCLAETNCPITIDFQEEYIPVIDAVTGARVTKLYDAPQTPYQRLLESGVLDDATRERLDAELRAINPADLKRRIESALRRLWDCTQQKDRRKIG